MAQDSAAACLCRGIIFDLDGTLVDTLDDITTSVNHAICEARFAPRSREDIRGMVGDGVAMLMREASGAEDDAVVAALVGRFRAHYADHYLDASRLYPGWAEALTRLSELGVPMGVLSNKPDDFTRRICAKLLADWPMVHVEGQREGVPLKPDPSRALAMCVMMDRRPDEVVLVGDSSHDIETARRGGLRAVAVTWGFRSRAQLIPCAPDLFVDHPAHLLPLVSSAR